MRRRGEREFEAVGQSAGKEKMLRCIVFVCSIKKLFWVTEDERCERVKPCGPLARCSVSVPGLRPGLLGSTHVYTLIVPSTHEFEFAWKHGNERRGARRRRRRIALRRRATCGSKRSCSKRSFPFCPHVEYVFV